MNPVNCPTCNAPMIHVCAADHRCDRCGFSYVADPVTMTRIDAALRRMSVECSTFVPHLVDLCSGAYVPDDDEPHEFDMLIAAGLWHEVSCLDIVVWSHFRHYLADLATSMHADEFPIVLEAA